jgi:mRNA-degrading endonuclease RelE of RelBE toxin-antitoxin system
MYQVVFRSRAVRTLKKLDRAAQAAILKALNQLAKNPFVHPNVRKLSGTEVDAFRLRVGRWRILYFIMRDDRVLEVVEIFMKKSPADYHIL